MKSYTNLEQSKKLAKILPLESADMTYDAITEGMRERMIIKDWQAKIGLDIAIKENHFSYRNGYVVPCWSLAALMNVLDRGALFITPQGWACQSYINFKAITSDYYSNPIDACYEMVIKLHELKML